MRFVSDVSAIASTAAYIEDSKTIATLEDKTQAPLEKRFEVDVTIKREDSTTERDIPPCLGHALVRLEQFRQLLPNWDSYGAAEISDKAIDVARDLLYQAQEDFSSLLEESGEEDFLKPNAVAPLNGGGVQLEWSGSAAEMEVEISPDGQLALLFVEGRGAEKAYFENNKATVSEIMVRLAHVLRLRP